MRPPNTTRSLYFKTGKVFSLDLLGRSFAHFLQIANEFHRIQLLDILGLYVREAERIQTFTRKLGIVTHIRKHFWARSYLSHHGSHFSVQGLARQAFSKDSAEKILLH